MNFRTKLLALLAAAPTFVLFAVQACGGDTSNGNDASTDGTTGDVTADVVVQDGAPDVVQTGDSACPTYSGNVEFCKAAVDRCNACPGATKFTTCERQNLDAVCSAAENIFSAQFAAAAGACATLCDNDASNACQKAELADASLTSAQQQLVTDYCAHCGANQGCATQAASQVIQYADPLVTTIDKTCVPDAGGPDSSACSKYPACSTGILIGAISTLPCADAATD